MAYVTLQEVREQAGFQYKERSESIGTGDGSTVIFYTTNKPIVNRNYSGSPVAISDIAVYLAGVSATPTALSAVLGKITLGTPVATAVAVTCDYDWSPLENTLVEMYLDEAHSLVLSRISEKYTLPLSTVPDIVKLIEKKLAAGFLLDKEYSVGGDETEDTRGRRWIKWAEKKLNEIVSGALDLLDASGNIVSQKTSVGLGGWPNETTKDAEEEDAGGDVVFRGKKEF